MNLLFDHNVNRRFRKYLPGHVIQTARERGWEKLANGALLQAAANAGFEALMSIDKKLEHEQNLSGLPLPIVLVDCVSNALPALLPFVPPILKLLSSPLDCALYIAQSDGTIIRLTSPRS